MRIIILCTLLCMLTPFYMSAQGLFESALETTGNRESDAYDLQGGLTSVVYTGYNTEEDQPYLQSIYSQLNLVSVFLQADSAKHLQIPGSVTDRNSGHGLQVLSCAKHMSTCSWDR